MNAYRFELQNRERSAKHRTRTTWAEVSSRTREPVKVYESGDAESVESWISSLLPVYILLAAVVVAVSNVAI